MMKSHRVVRVLQVLAGVMLAGGVLSAQTPEFRHLQGGLIEGMTFFNSIEGWTGEDGGRIRMTTDGGLTWTFADTDDESPGSWVLLRGLCFLDNGEGGVIGWAVGEDGVVLQSTDGAGMTWSDLNPSNRVTSAIDLDDDCGEHLASLYDIFMIDDQNGWVVGLDGAIAVTADGGESWAPAHENFGLSCIADPVDRYDIHFFEDSGSGSSAHAKGLAIGEYGRVYWTEDSGASWSVLQIHSQPEDPACPEIPTGHAPPLGNLELWEMTIFDPADYATALFVAGGIGTNKGYLYYRSPGWTSGTWQQEWCCQFEDGGGEEPEDYEDTCTLPTQYTIQVLDAGTGHSIAAGYAGEIYAFESGTSNFDPCECAAGTGFCASGDTWVEKSTAIAGVNYSHETPYFSGARVSNTTAVVAGAFGRITRYVDGGSPEVADVASTVFNRLYDGEFTSTSTGCVVGQNQIVLRSTDGGETWEEADIDWTPSESEDFNAIDFSSSGQYGLAVGTSGLVARTTDYGATWDGTDYGSHNVQDVAFAPGTSTAYVVTAAGNVLRSTDNGQTWTAKTSPASVILKGIAVAETSADVLYVVGSGASAYISGDGGTTWSAVTVTGGSGETFFDVATWDDGTEAILVAAGGGVYVKASTAFVRQDLGALATTADLYDVEVLDDGDTVRIGGNRGVALFRDGGTWTRPRSATSVPIYRMAFQAADHGFAIGRNFLIAEYD